MVKFRTNKNKDVYPLTGIIPMPIPEIEKHAIEDLGKSLKDIQQKQYQREYQELHKEEKREKRRQYVESGFKDPVTRLLRDVQREVIAEQFGLKEAKAEVEKEKEREYNQRYRETHPVTPEQQALKNKAELLRRQEQPWIQTLANIHKRINDPEDTVYFGMQNLISTEDLKKVWERDEAWNLKEPSIDRIDPKEGYFPRNIRYIELPENRAKVNKPLTEKQKKDVYLGTFGEED